MKNGLRPIGKQRDSYRKVKHKAEIWIPLSKQVAQGLGSAYCSRNYPGINVG